jgi:RNA polymerase sigma-70 factor (ECF subfamily)
MSKQFKYSLDRENSRMERFIQLYARHQQYLFSYVLALVPQWADAENVAESTQLVLWRKFEQYLEGTSFLDWAKHEAKSEVLKYRERRKKEWLCFSADVVKKLDLELRSMDGMLQCQRESLSACLAKLPEKSRILLYHRYRDNATVNQVAEKLGYSVVSVGKALQRIRHALLVCVTKITPAEEQR